MFSTVKAARALGWTSVAVGVTELVATNWLQREIGVKGHDKLIKSFGLREIAAGVTLLAQPGLNRTLAAGLWGRVVGDAADLALLGKAGESTRRPAGLARITSLVIAITGLDVLVAAVAQHNLSQVGSVSSAARRRVRPTPAIPSGKRMQPQSNAAKPALASAPNA